METIMFDFLICLPVILVGFVLLGVAAKIWGPYILDKFV
jgi:hypothetical protein